MQQPINVKDVAWAVVEVINSKKCIKEIFNISGEKPLTYNEIIKIISSLLGRSTRKIYLPKKFSIKIFQYFEHLGINFPIKSEQIERINEDKSFSHNKAKNIFNFTPISFNKGIESEIELYRKNI